jgi:hypothetical protein
LKVIKGTRGVDVDVAEDKPVAEVISEVVAEGVLATTFVLELVELGGELEVIVAYPRTSIIATTKTALA